MSKSIMQSDNSYCYLCKKLRGDDFPKVTEEHHVFNGPRKRLSTKYGLTVRLCIPHHRLGTEAVHLNAKMMHFLKSEGQKAFEKKYPDKDFMEIFGKNYRED